MKRIFIRAAITAAAVYLVLSAAITAAYNLLPAQSWEIARHRNGLLIFTLDEGQIYMLSPFDNWGDSWV